MSERGLSTGALVGIIVGVVVATVVPVTVVAVVLGVGGGGAAGGLPVYAGAAEFKRTETDVTGGHLTSVYYDLGTANLGDVYSWYKSQMPGQGWTLTGDTPYPDYNSYTINYTKGNDSVEIVIVQGSIEGYSATKILVLAYTAATGGTPS